MAPEAITLSVKLQGLVQQSDYLPLRHLMFREGVVI